MPMGSPTFTASIASTDYQTDYNHPRRNYHLKLQTEMSRNAAVVPELRTLYKSRAKLKAASSTSALLAGFAMVALVELDLQVGVDRRVPLPLLITYGICTSLLVSVHLLALMMSTCILPEMEAITTLQSISNDPNAAAFKKLPHHALSKYITAAWFFSTGLGLLLFLMEVGIIFWIKFTLIGFHNGSYITTALLLPFFIMLFVFTIGLYRKMNDENLNFQRETLGDLELMLDNVVPAPYMNPSPANSDVYGRDRKTSMLEAGVLLGGTGSAIALGNARPTHRSMDSLTVESAAHSQRGSHRTLNSSESVTVANENEVFVTPTANRRPHVL